jgi:hypothetical protein
MKQRLSTALLILIIQGEEYCLAALLHLLCQAKYTGRKFSEVTMALKK